MAKGIIRDLRKALDKVDKEINANSSGRDDFYARGLSSEGYAGGYAAALRDVDLALRGITPSNSRYWPVD